MKKILSFAAGAVLLCAAVSTLFIVNKEGKDDIFYANVEALADGEHTTGSCEEHEFAGIGVCPGCGQLVEAFGHMGPAMKINHCQCN